MDDAYLWHVIDELVGEGALTMVAPVFFVENLEFPFVADIIECSTNTSLYLNSHSLKPSNIIFH